MKPSNIDVQLFMQLKLSSMHSSLHARLYSVHVRGTFVNSRQTKKHIILGGVENKHARRSPRHSSYLLKQSSKPLSQVRRKTIPSDERMNALRDQRVQKESSSCGVESERITHGPSEFCAGGLPPLFLPPARFMRFSIAAVVPKIPLSTTETMVGSALTEGEAPWLRQL